MSLFSDNRIRLGCFSPLVMISTFAIEVVGALWVAVRYKRTTTSVLIIALLVMLATFQFAEYMVCEGAFGVSSLDWARIGYVAITLLPALGMHLAMTIAGQTNKYAVVASYAVATLFSIFFLFSGEHGVQNDICMGNYVIFEMSRNLVYLYALYYYTWLLVGMIYAYHTAREMKSEKKRKALNALSIGYFSFIFPTTLVNIIDPTTMAAIPSIMCGFAVILALILVGFVAPSVCTVRSGKKQ